MIGAHADAVARKVVPGDVADAAHFWSSDEPISVLQALGELETVGFLEEHQHSLYRLTQTGREHLRDPYPFWGEVCTMYLEEDHAAVLTTINRLSPMTAPSGVMVLRTVDQSELLPTLGWGSEGIDRLY